MIEKSIDFMQKKTDTIDQVNGGMCLFQMVNDRDFASCDVRFFSVFGNLRPPAFWSSFWNPTFFQELADRYVHLLTPRSLPCG